MCAGAWAQGSVSSAGAVVAQESTAAGARPGATVEEPGGSQVRIVRLSQVRGNVRMDRNTGRGFEGAFTNIPVVAGVKLLTGEGVAEVEFEDNSSLRLAPESEVEFTQLGRSADGTTLTTAKLGKGMAYVSMQKGKGAGNVTLQYGPVRVAMGPGAHLRVDATQPQVELAVFDGSVRVEMGSATTTLTKKQTVSLDPVGQTMTPVSKGVQEVVWDAWDSAQAGYHKNVSALAGSAGGFGLYGANDLGYYGSFVDMPGCGSMWRPYFADAGWDPFGNGIWAYYQGAGFSWVSPYPWGWLPFHSGTWASCGAAGWGWRPGGAWVGLTNHGLMRIAHCPRPHPLPPTPVKGGGTLVPVNTKPLAISGLSSDGKFTFRGNSAGLGVPRQSFGKLGGFSSHAEQRGVAFTSAMSLTTSPSAVGLTGGGRSGAGENGGRSFAVGAGGGRSSAMGAGGGRSSAIGAGRSASSSGVSGGGGGMHSGGSSGSGGMSSASAGGGGGSAGGHH